MKQCNHTNAIELEPLFNRTHVLACGGLDKKGNPTDSCRYITTDMSSLKWESGPTMSTPREKSCYAEAEEDRLVVVAGMHGQCFMRYICTVQ